MKLSPILQQIRLSEYSDKIMNQMVTLYKSQTSEPEDQIISNIKRFQQLAGTIDKKFKEENPVLLSVLPDELKKPNTIRDITKYQEYDTLIKVLKAADSKPQDIYKQAIEFYKKQNQYLPPNIIGNYVARFKKNLKDLEDKVKEKDEATLSVVPKDLREKDRYLNILNWRNFEELERMLDSIFPTSEEGATIDQNDARVNGELIYENEKDQIEIYKGDSEERCIKYGKGYGWCIGRGMYSNYRYLQHQASHKRMFYFVFDRSLPKEDKYHAVVIHAFSGGGYTRTTAINGDEGSPKSWEELGELIKSDKGSGPAFWSKIKNLESYFKFIAPSKDEQRKIGFRGQRKTLAEYSQMDKEDQRDWARANATDNNIVTSEIVKSMPPFDNTLEGPSKNDLINHDRIFTYDELKGNIGLIKRYADYRYTRGLVLPPIYLMYLKPELKEDYYQKHSRKYLTFELIKKYLGDEYAQRYINDISKELQYIPKEYIHLVPNKYKNIYKLFSILTKNWSLFQGANDVDNIENETQANSQNVDVNPLYYDDLKKLSPEMLKNIKSLAFKINDNNKYKDIIYALPTIVKQNGRSYFLVPKDEEASNELTNWYIIDDNMNIVKTFNAYDMVLNKDSGLTKAGFIDYETDKVLKVVNGDDIKIDKKPFSTLLKEDIYENTSKYIFQRKAGII